MDFQTGFDIVLALAGFLGGFILKALWDGLKELRKTDEKLADKVASIEVVVAGEYVKREDFKDFVQGVFSRLDTINTKLDQKIDRADCNRQKG